MEPNFWITSVASWKDRNPGEVINDIVGKEKIYALKAQSHGRKLICPNDWICFYIPKKGISAHAKIDTSPEIRKCDVFNEIYPWIFSLSNVDIYIHNPVILNKDILRKLDAFRGKDLSKPWSWFVQSTKRVSRNDFRILVRHKI